MDHSPQHSEELQYSSNDITALQTVTAYPALAPELAWERLRAVEVDRARLAENRIVTLDRTHTAYAAFDMMRTRTLQTLRNNQASTIVITSPTPKCGKTTITLNLAFSLSHQLDCRTVVLDLNLKTPRFEDVLGVAAPFSIDTVLSGATPIARALVRVGENLAIGTCHRSVEYSAELLQSREAAKVLKQMQIDLAADVILVDMPAMLGSDDVTAFLPNADCALLVAAAEDTTIPDIDACERHLAERTQLMGVILNNYRHT